MLDSQQKEQNSAPAGPEPVPESEGDEIQVSASPNGGPDDPPPAEAEAEVDPVQAELERLQSEKAELLDRFQRAQAEFENLRKRLMREKDEAREYAAMGTIRSLLPVADDFERALDAPGMDPEVRKGLDLVHKALFEVFTRAGLKPVEEEGNSIPTFTRLWIAAPLKPTKTIKTSWKSTSAATTSKNACCGLLWSK